MPRYTVADPGLMKGGFSGDTKILARGAHNGKWSSRARSAPSRGSGGMPPRKILNFRSSEMISGTIFYRDRYSLGIYLNIDG